MGESTNSSDDSSPKNAKGNGNREKSSRTSMKIEKRVTNALPKTFTPSSKTKQVEQNTQSPLKESDNKSTIDINDTSPVIKSRYGRTHKPKIPEDFLPTDKKVAAILGHSPHKSPSKNLNSLTSSPSDVTKVTAKGRKLYDIFTKKDKHSNGTCESVDNKEITKKSETETSDNVRDENSENKPDTVTVNGLITHVNVKGDSIDTSVQKIENLPACDWMVGDLAWARVSGYPFWPCMIALDPEKGIFSRIITRGSFSVLHLHVQFFGDNGRRSWLYSNCVIPFDGLEALNQLSNKIQNEVKKRDKKLAAAFHVTPKAKAKWDIAVVEAEAALRRTREERIQDFAIQFPYDTPKKSKKNENTIASPLGKQNQLKAAEDVQKDNKHSANNSMLSDGENSATSPQSAKKKPQRKKYNANAQNLRGDFKVYMAKYIDRVSDEHPELSKKAVEKYLAKEWREMDDQQKSKFNMRMSNNDAAAETSETSDQGDDTEDSDDNDSREDEGDDAEEEEEFRESSDSGKASGTETREFSPAPYSKLRKGGGLFRGTKQEKVCQICEKPGDTVKCKGPCCGSFHLSCISKISAIETEESSVVLIEEDGTPNTCKEIKLENGEALEEEISKITLNGIIGKKRKRQESCEDNGTEIFISKKKEKLDKDKFSVNIKDNEGMGSMEIEDNGISKCSISVNEIDKNKVLCYELSTNEIDDENVKDKILQNEIEYNKNSREQMKENIEDKESGIEEVEELDSSKEKIENNESGNDNIEDKESGIEEIDSDKEKIENIVSDKMDIEDKENNKVNIEGKEYDKEKIGDIMKNCSGKKNEYGIVQQSGVNESMDSDNTDSHGSTDEELAPNNKMEEGEIKGINEESSNKNENKATLDQNDQYDKTLINISRKKEENGVLTSKVAGHVSRKTDENRDITEVPRRVSRRKDENRDLISEIRRVSKRRDENVDISSEVPRHVSKRRHENTYTSELPRRVSRKREENYISEAKNKEKESGDKKSSNKRKEKEEKKDSEDDGTEFRCWDCRRGQNPPCFACSRKMDTKTGKELRHRCAVGHCGKFYHPECLKLWPHAWSNGGSASRRHAAAAARGNAVTTVTCPQHVCHTCASDDPRNVTTRYNHERLVRCIRCPTAYHTGNYCLPAGSEVLTGSQIICPKHYEPPPKKTYHVNAAWCFICAMGGSLICCDLCPTSFHAECLHISAPEGSFICEDCDTGRFPLYGEIVWVKLGAYRWWPAQILYPNQIPDNILNLPHVLGEFAVRFFGSHDHYWVNRGRVFLYQEGDTGHSTSRKSYMEGIFCRALQEASEAHKTLKGEKATRDAEARPVMKPPMYVKIKSNKHVGNVRVMEMDPASTTPCDCDPKSDNPCGPETDCLNRILLVECSPSVCLAGERCGNQCFEKRQYPPLVPYRTETRGWGLKTLADIRKGDFVIEYVGEMIDETEYQHRMTRKHEEKDENYYFLTIDKDRMLDAGPKGNVARFMNHSCQPNCETQKWTVNGDTRVGLFALEDIPAGTELTFNYNLECVGPDKKPCMCGAPNCSGFIGMKVNKAEEDKKPRSDHLNVAKRRKKRKHEPKLSDDLCFICGKGGELLLCDNKTCPKGYHVHCLKLKQSPQGKWHCPWHRCNECNKRTVRRCSYCPSSFCPCHSDGNIRLHPTLGLVCQKHDKETNLVIKQEPMEILELDVKTDTEEMCSSPAPRSTHSDETVNAIPVGQKRKRGRPRKSSIEGNDIQSLTDNKNSSKQLRRDSEPALNGLAEDLLKKTSESFTAGNVENVSLQNTRSIQLQEKCNEPSDPKSVCVLPVES